MKIDCKKLNDAIKEKGIKAIRIAEALNVDHSTVGYWVHGQRGISISNIVKLCEFIGIEPKDIIKDKKQLERYSVEYALAILKLHGWKGVM